jgi:hypothetical protein
MATLVKFRKEISNHDQIVAVFPKLKHNSRLYGNDVYVCYSHIGQHSPCNKDWIFGETKPAKEHEYASLKKELESIGYDLKICK